jgi:predicted metal-dependent hydrolase
MQRHTGVVAVLSNGADTAGSADSPITLNWRSQCCSASASLLPHICVSGEEIHAPRRLSDWLRTEVRRDINICILKHAKTLGCSPKRIAIRDQATRWGSCSTSGTLSFSWRLIFAPPFVLDYVAAHEVAHLREMNHGPRFWRLVKEAAPAMQTARLWLKTHGAELHRFGGDYEHCAPHSSALA